MSAGALSWRSSSLYDWERTGCAAVLVHERQGTPRDEQMFAAGEVAHLLLDAAARETKADPMLFGDSLEKRLGALSRSYLDHMPRWGTLHKPPVGPAEAAEGLRLALGWISSQGVPEGQSETGMALGADLKTPVPYGSDGARWSSLVDLTFAVEDFDEYTGADLLILTVADYKSAWPDQDALTLQRKGQAVAVMAHRSASGKTPPDRLVLETRNLRRRSISSPYVSDDPEGDVELWREELAVILERADKAASHHTVDSAARVGPGCERCPYLRHCGPGLGFVANPTVADPESAPSAVEALVASWGSAAALSKLFAGYLAAIVDRNGGQIQAGDQIITRGEKMRRRLREDFPSALWSKWYTGMGDPESVIRGLLARLNIGVSNVEALIKTLPAEERKDFRKWLVKRTIEEREPWGIKVSRKAPGMVE